MKPMIFIIYLLFAICTTPLLYSEGNQEQPNTTEQVVPDFSQNAYSQIMNELEESRDIRLLDSNTIKEIQVILHVWAAGTINFDLAVVREATRFISYRQRLHSYYPRILSERLDYSDNEENNSFPSLQLEKYAQLESPLTALIREGENYFYWYFPKKTRFTGQYDATYLSQLVVQFIRENRFVFEDSEDRIDSVSLVERRIDEELPGENQGGDDYLIQTDFRVYRRFMNLPVENSVITLGILPKQYEIVRLQYVNWAPVLPYDEKSVIPAPEWSFDQMKDKLLKLISGEGTNLEEIYVEQASPGWYQTKDSLIPIIVISGDMKIIVNQQIIPKEFRVTLNLGGDEEEIYKQ